MRDAVVSLINAGETSRTLGGWLGSEGSPHRAADVRHIHRPLGGVCLSLRAPPLADGAAHAPPALVSNQFASRVSQLAVYTQGDERSRVASVRFEHVRMNTEEKES